MTPGRESNSSPAKHLALRFGPGEPAGFTSVGVAGFQDLNPAAVVRELVQNSLDAAREAGRKIACVRFEVVEHRIDLVPGIREFREAFGSACETQKRLGSGGLPSQARPVVRAIQQALERDRCQSLFVLDNGVGLNAERMNGLLGDGLSVKADSGAGAFGNGHYTVIPASDLRYILYGGLSRDETAICAGHAILASHEQDGRVCGKDGYLIKSFREGALFDRYEFARGEQVPRYLEQKLQWIAQNWGPGTVVAVPAFNRFRVSEEKKDLWGLVVRPAACSFFAAIHQGSLRLEVVERGRERILDDRTIASELQDAASEKRSRAFLSGSRAKGAYDTLVLGRTHKVKTAAGDLSIKLRELLDGGVSRVDLCRAGMWVSDDLPKLRRSQLSDLKPFHCVIDLNAGHHEIYKLVRAAEGPLHNHIEARKWLPKEQRDKLEGAFQQIAAAIRENIGAFSDDPVRVDDVLAFNTQGVELGGRQSARRGMFAEMRLYHPEAEPADEASEDGRAGGRSESHGGGGGRTARPTGRPVRLHALAVPTAPRSCRVELRPAESFAAAEVRFALDESIDETCDRIGGETYVLIHDVKLDGQAVDPSVLTKNGTAEAVGVGLEVWSAGQTRILEFGFRLPASVQVPDGTKVVLKTIVFRRAKRKRAVAALAGEEGE